MKYICFLLLLVAANPSFGQSAENEQLIELGKAYKNFMFIVEPPKGFVQQLAAAPAQFRVPAAFIAQTISTKNQLLSKQYLTVPDEQSLKYIYAVRQVNFSLRKEGADANKLLDSLKLAATSRYELIDSYYEMLFSAVGNKNKPFNLAKVDFRPAEYGLTNDTERGILFLECMRFCGLNIWGYMNVVKPPNTKEAYAYIKRYPSFNGLKYFQYNDLSFPDFQMVIIAKEGKQSYKQYYLDKYYDVLLSHLICLHEQGGSEKEKQELLLGSILRERTLYKYSKRREVLEKLFQEQKQ